MNKVMKKIRRCRRLGLIKYIKFKRSRFVAVMKKVIGGPLLIVSRGWAWCTKYETVRIFLSLFIAALIVLLILSILAMWSVMMYPSAKCYFMSLTGTETKPELLKFIGWGASGIIATLVAFGILQRAAALEEQNKITKEGQDKGHIHERFKAAIDHLGNKESVSVRIAAFNEFYRLAELDPEAGLKKTIFDILCAHLRQTTKAENYQKEGKDSGASKSTEIEPTEEVQSLLDILFKPNNENKLIFGGIDANLEGVNLQGAKLNKANLQKANLQRAKLQRAKLQEAKLQEANLEGAKLGQANLQKANLEKAKMALVDTYNTDMFLAKLQGTFLEFADLSNAIVHGADMREARINNSTKMPDGWKEKVKKDENGKTGVLLVDFLGQVRESY